MKPTKGLHLDNRPEDQPQGTYPFGKNGLQHDLVGAVSNEPGFRRIVTEATLPGYQLNGILETDSDLVVLFMTNGTYSCIRLINTTTEAVVFHFLDQNVPYKLGFSIDNYITGQVQRNYLGELICAFTDKVKFPKVINFDNPQTAQLKDWNLFPECVYPEVTKNLEAGGYCEVGSYFFTGRYYKQDGTRTACGPVGSGIAVTSLTGQAVADKAIRLTFTGMDTAYQFFELIVITKIQGVTAAKIVKLVPVVPGTSTIVFTNDQVYESIALEEVLAPQVSYDKVGSMGQLNDALYVGNLETTQFITDMQQYANLVKVFWVSELVDVENCPDWHKSGERKSLKHQETYALYIRYKLTNGSSTIGFHLPGVDALPAELALSAVASAGSVAAPVYKTEDCINTYSTTTFSGVPGTYLNDTEVYPNTDDFDSSALGGEDLRNTRVRHHKMPSLKWCRENLYTSEPTYGSRKMDILGLQIFNVIIPPKYANLIVGYEIMYAKRTVQNMTVYGQSLLIHGSEKSGDPTTVYSTGHNTSVVHAPAATSYTLKLGYMRLHPFDVLYNTPGIIPSHITAQYKLETDLDPKYLAGMYTGTPSNSKMNCVHLADMMKNTATVSAAPTSNILGIQSPKYLINNSLTGEYVNQYIESAFVGKLIGTPWSYGAFPTDTVTALLYGGHYAPGSRVQSYLVDLSDVKVNLYENFYTQELVSAGDSKPLTSSGPFWGGDVFLSQYTFHTYGVMDSNWQNYYDLPPYYAEAADRTRRVVHRVITETVANLYTRFETPGNMYSKWYTNTALPLAISGDYKQSYPTEFNSTIDPNQFGVSKGGEAINDFIPDDIFNPFRIYQTKFPYRIHRGGKLSRQNTRSWKTFLPLDYYEMQRNMGFIQHLEGMDDRLLIHMTNALFITQDKGKLEGGMLSITLGSGDIFQFEPQEVQSSKLGYGGTQTDLACIRTPIGYIYPDTKQGEFYLYKDKELRMLNDGLYRFLREYLKVMGNNPFSGNGVTLGWDQKYKRILATIKNIRPAGNPKIVVLNAPTDIQSIGTLMGPPNYDDVLFTVNGTVKPGEIVFMNNKFLVYKGINNITPGAESPYTCPPDDVVCDPPLNLEVEQTIDPPFAHLTWGGDAGTFQWELFKIVSGVLQLVASGTTNSQFQDFDSSILDADVLYFFSVRRVCGPDFFSTPATVSFSYPEPVIITPPPPGSANVNFRFFKMKVPIHTCGVISNGTNNVYQAVLTVNGVVLGTYVLGTGGGCSYSTFTASWAHALQVGPYFTAPVTGSATAATIVVECQDSLGNPASGAFAPTPLLDSSLVPQAGVLSGGSNHICTWTNIDLTVYSYIDLTV